MTYYVKTDEFGEIAVKDNGDGSMTFIPMSEENSDFTVYQQWLLAGNMPEPWPSAE